MSSNIYSHRSIVNTSKKILFELLINPEKIRSWFPELRLVNNSESVDLQFAKEPETQYVIQITYTKYPDIIRGIIYLSNKNDTLEFEWKISEIPNSKFVNLTMTTIEPKDIPVKTCHDKFSSIFFDCK